MTPHPIVWTAVPVPYALLVRLRERGDPGTVIARILEQVLADPLPRPTEPPDHSG